MRFVVLALLVLVPPPQDSAEKAWDKLLKAMDAGRFQEGRAIAMAIVRQFPKSPVAERAKNFAGDNSYLRILPIEVNGLPSNRLDLVLMADGVEYEDRKQQVWEKETDPILRAIFKVDPMREYSRYFNLYRANVASKEPRLNRAEGSLTTYFGGREDNGDLLYDGQAARDVAKMCGDDDGLALLQIRPGGAVHSQCGHGVAAFSGPRPTATRIQHAWAHALAGLGDEFSAGGGWGWGGGGDRKDPPAVPETVNVTEDATKVPWAHWLEAKKAGDKRAAAIDILEGAHWRTRRCWKAVPDGECLLSGGPEFCAVCREALTLMLYTHVRPIDGGSPFEKPVAANAEAPIELHVRTLQPATHKLKVEWIYQRINKGEKYGGGSDAKGGTDTEGRFKDLYRCRDGRPGDRKGEGPKWKKPLGEVLPSTNKDGKDVVILDPRKIGGGPIRVYAIVTDPTEFVLLDEQNLLVDWRCWIVEFP